MREKITPKGYELNCQHFKNKAENEKLKNDLEWLNGQYLIQDMALQTAKAEAIKEFARELMLIPRNTVRKDEIKNLLKEKVGEDNS
jgi:hypothetical protein